MFQLAAFSTALLAGGVPFDWVVDFTQTFDTTGALIQSEQGELLSVKDGVVIVDSLTVTAGSTLRVIGENPLKIFVRGDVTIDGKVDLSGFHAQDVQSLNQATVPEPGGAGAAGGGQGGTASFVTTASTPYGGSGFGPFGAANGGGRGGESGFSGGNQRNLWRPGGGGGGAFAATALGRLSGDFGTDGLAAQPGWSGMDTTLPGMAGLLPGDGAFGAVSGLIPAHGGRAGGGAFADERPGNDFWGIGFGSHGLVGGELNSLHAGTGGGAGGDAISSETFPSPIFIDPTFNHLTPNDHKGAGGGGGGGGLHLVVLGDVVLGPGGCVQANGGNGGAGESTFFIDRVGGAGGGGSGGHLVIETAGHVDLSSVAAGHVAFSAVGGEGGGGMPLGQNPEGTDEFSKLFEVLERPVNQGGDGGPGVIQLHVIGTNPQELREKVLLPAGSELGDHIVPRPHVLLPLRLPLLR